MEIPDYMLKAAPEWATKIFKEIQRQSNNDIIEMRTAVFGSGGGSGAIPDDGGGVQPDEVDPGNVNAVGEIRNPRRGIE